ncbi:MAG: DUF4268 domain-containing protein [Candidatus Gastranaerophilales bacterium]|nr:DUF4268 domain-containing protein [Candidatus Gastranaerophilales bacterium]
MTDTFLPDEILKSRQNFSDYIEANSEKIISQITRDYPKHALNVVTAQLTQNDEGLINAVENFTNVQSGYIFWFVVNEKERLVNIARTLNKNFSKNYGIFIIKTFLNEDKIDFECILKPEIPTKTIRNENTPAKLLQKEYWEQYFEICDELQSEMQVTPAPRHYQYITMGKAGVQIVQTVNTKDNYAATEIMINNNKEIFNKLLENKSEIEEKLGTLDWQFLEGKKSSRIRKLYSADIANPTTREETIKNHIKMAEDFRETFRKYL